MQIGSDPGNRIRLRQVLPEAELIGTDDIEVAGCARDPRSVNRGDLFVALPGRVHDGHDSAHEAVASGAAAILAERPLAGVTVPVALVPDTREAYGRICQALAGNPSQRIKVIGVTGAGGKTTTCCLIANVLSTAGHHVGLMSTLGCFDGLDTMPAGVTTPPSDRLAEWLARSAAGGCTHAVLEVSQHGLRQSRTAGITLDAACVTNTRRDLLDYRRSPRDDCPVRSRLVDHLSDQGFAVFNADDPASATYLGWASIPALTFGTRSAAEISGVLVEQYASEQTFLLTAGSETVPVRTRMIGIHHVYNCLAAAAVGLAYGIDLATVVRGIERVEQIPGRLERIECGQPFGVYVDCARTPGGLSGSLETLREVIHGRLICVFGAGGDRNPASRPLMGRAVEAGADVAVITTDNPRTEDPRDISRDLLRGFRHPDDAKLIADRAEAIGWALSEARPGDGVLIAGKGHEKCQIIGHRKHPFDDCEEARAWLYEYQPAGLPLVTP